MNKSSFVNLEIGNTCNLKCKFCYNDKPRETKQLFLDIEELKKTLINLKNKGVNSVNIIGGEPLIYPDFFTLLDFLNNNNFKISIVTNGVYLGNKNFNQKFLKYKNIIYSINLSVHSNNNQIEDKITNGKNIFDKKIKAIEFLEKNNFNYSLSLVISNENIFHLKDIINFYYTNFNKKLSLQGMLTFSKSSLNNYNILPSYTEIIKQINNLGDISNYISRIHWIPLCIHSKIKNIKYNIRELNKKYIYSLSPEGKNLLTGQIGDNYIGKKCKNCHAFLKFCTGPGKLYVKKYGYDEFCSLTKDDIVKLGVISNLKK